MQALECDVLIIGAGPAGSAAALNAAGEGLRVLVVERRAVIGVPVQCAEYIPAPLVGEVNLGRHFVAQSLRGMKTILPGKAVKETIAPGFTIYRDRFDQTLVEAAREAGAEILLSTRAISIDRKKRVTLKSRNGRLSKVLAKVIIGADGPRSKVGGWIGSVNRCLAAGIQVKADLVNPLEFAEVYFDPEIFAGYGWLFPKGRKANVGIALKKNAGQPYTAREVLGRFVSRMVLEGKIRGEHFGYTAGWIPVGPVRKSVHENVLLAGDAAGHTHPITGAGIFPAFVSGRMAGKWAARAVRQKDLGLLLEYEAEWRDLFGETLERAFRRRQILENEWGRLEAIIKYCWVAYREYYAGSD